MSEPNGERISVSREALRAELAELELRLYNKLASDLLLKADAARVASLEQRQTALELASARREKLADEFREAQHKLNKLERTTLDPVAVGNMIGDALRQNQARGWTVKERGLQALVALSSLAAFGLLVSQKL